jgi:hypothetical protein
MEAAGFSDGLGRIHLPWDGIIWRDSVNTTMSLRDLLNVWQFLKNEFLSTNLSGEGA